MEEERNSQEGSFFSEEESLSSEEEEGEIGQRVEEAEREGEGLRKTGFWLTVFLVIVFSFAISFYIGHRMQFPVRLRSGFKKILPLPANEEKKSSLTVPALQGEPTKKLEAAPETKQEVSRIYKVQLGSFSTFKGAQTFGEELKRKGLPIYVCKVENKWRVQVGAFRDRKLAEQLVAELRREGLTVFLNAD